MASPDSLRIAITALHQAIVDHPDPESMQILGQCLQMLLKVQAKDYAGANQQLGPDRAVAIGTLMNGPGAGPPG